MPKVGFLASFFALGFLMKLLGEFVHEVLGHGSFVLLFGGKITEVHIAVLWPYRLSSIAFSSPPGGFSDEQLVWVMAGGILACLVLSSLLQAFLHARGRLGIMTLGSFWLGFWTFINPSGYLIIGAIRPFGDIEQLIRLGALSRTSSAALGLMAFALSFFSFSILILRLMARAGIAGDRRNARLYLVMFWLVVPVVTILALLGTGLSLAYLPLAFVPVALALALPSVIPDTWLGIPSC